MHLRKRILLVDDEPSICLYLEEHIRDRGYEVVAFGDPVRAIAEVEKGGVAVVLTDIRLPGLSGLELTRRVKALSPDTSVILMTGYASLDTAAEGLRAGACDYLLKPFYDLGLVVSSIDPALERQRLEAEAVELRRRLVHADRLAAIGQLAAGVAHEINNPAAFVLGNLGVMKARLSRLGSAAPVYEMDAVVEDLGRMIDEALEGVERIRSIVRELHSFSRVDSGGVALASVNDAVRSAITLVGGAVRARARLEVSLGDVPAIAIHPGRLGQVFVNLIVNAAQAVPEGDTEHNCVTVTTRCEAGRVLVSVQDTGCGMSEAVRSRVFEPFFTTKPNGQGTGLGLSLSADIVEAHRGEITVESAPSRGSTFQVSLPVDTGLRPAPPPRPMTEAGPAVAGPRLRVLLVDDEPLLLAAFGRMLEEECDVVTAGGGREALRVLEADRGFDAVVCDIMMPDLDGLRVYAQIEERWPDLARRVILSTGGIMGLEARDRANLGGSGALEKPFRSEQLLAAVQRAASGEPLPGRDPF